MRLLLHRRTMVSLTYTASEGMLCGDLAMGIILDLQSHASEGPTPARFHIATTLGTPIIILATLLCRDLDALGLQDRRAAYIESYRAGLSMLREIATHLYAARRIIEGLKNIINVVDLVLQDRPQAHGQTRDFSDRVPATMDQLFPYSMMDSSVDLMSYDVFGASNSINQLSPTALGSREQDMSMPWDSWDNELMWTSGRQGVPDV